MQLATGTVLDAATRRSAESHLSSCPPPLDRDATGGRPLHGRRRAWGARRQRRVAGTRRPCRVPVTRPLSEDAAVVAAAVVAARRCDARQRATGGRVVRGVPVVPRVD